MRGNRDALCCITKKGRPIIRLSSGSGFVSFLTHFFVTEMVLILSDSITKVIVYDIKDMSVMHVSRICKL